MQAHACQNEFDRLVEQRQGATGDQGQASEGDRPAAGSRAAALDGRSVAGVLASTAAASPQGNANAVEKITASSVADVHAERGDHCVSAHWQCGKCDHSGMYLSLLLAAVHAKR